ncbi:hypothetical protein [Bacillus sp. K2I17]|uniref:hypothetical protein n=1 Tax=Bacillus sp. K2I17 TaxID=2014743 RepID=UPI000B51BFDD|nr:hypothetical protein [Bacillus sp. K2I17]OWT48983.1 hypothetical protein CER22_22775 [Bacillus sp. K2I17]
MKLKGFVKKVVKFKFAVIGSLGGLAFVLSNMTNVVEEMTKLLLAMGKCVMAMKELLNLF